VIINVKKESKDNRLVNSNLTRNFSKRKDPSYIYLDENNQIKEIPLSKLDSAGALINRTVYKNPAKLIHEFMFGK
jgi:hypothetical protein